MPLRYTGDELRSRALPTFSTILHTIAPPISQHERLQIHITHDLVGYPALDPLIYETFSRVMSQVEGGDLLVIQRGSESGPARRRASEAGYAGSAGGYHGWSDGPWWRQDDAQQPRSLGAVKGLAEGTKLARVQAETYAADFFAARGGGGVAEATRLATGELTSENPVRRSDIFLAIQAVAHVAPAELFRGNATPSKDGTDAPGGGIVIDAPEKPDELVSFAAYLHDPVHDIAFCTVSQAFPQQWADWLNAPAPESGEASTVDGRPRHAALPQEIQDIIQGGGVDPREWISEWMEEVLALSVGVTAQRYVARRMGVGEGGIGRGKRRQEAVESGGGEAARAI